MKKKLRSKENHLGGGGAKPKLGDQFSNNQYERFERQGEDGSVMGDMAGPQLEPIELHNLSLAS